MQFLTKNNFLHTARTTQNKKLSAWLLCAGTLLLPTSLIAGELTQYQASYDILRKGTNHGKAERELKKLDNNNYQVTYHSDIEWMIFSDSRQESSTFSFINEIVYRDQPTCFTCRSEKRNNTRVNCLQGANERPKCDKHNLGFSFLTLIHIINLKL